MTHLILFYLPLDNFCSSPDLHYDLIASYVFIIGDHSQKAAFKGRQILRMQLYTMQGRN